MQSEKNWQIIVEPLVKQAGSILLSHWGKPLSIHVKKEGFYTQADVESERFLIGQLTRVFPEATIWAEESGKAASNGSGYRWVIDPLDGTTNFARNIPYFCVSVALTYNDVPVCAAIYEPLTKEFFYAQAGRGATLNGKPITVSRTEQLPKAMVAFGLAYGNDQRVPIVDLARRVAHKSYAVRHLGAVALDLAFMAAGRFDGLIFSDLSWWDVAAGILLIQEAGGKVTTFEGGAIGPDFKTCVAGNPGVWSDLCKLVRS